MVYLLVLCCIQDEVKLRYLLILLLRIQFQYVLLNLDRIAGLLFENFNFIWFVDFFNWFDPFLNYFDSRWVSEEWLLLIGQRLVNYGHTRLLLMAFFAISVQIPRWLCHWHTDCCPLRRYPRLSGFATYAGDLHSISLHFQIFVLIVNKLFLFRFNITVKILFSLRHHSFLWFRQFCLAVYLQRKHFFLYLV